MSNDKLIYIERNIEHIHSFWHNYLVGKSGKWLSVEILLCYFILAVARTFTRVDIDEKIYKFKKFNISYFL